MNDSHANLPPISILLALRNEERDLDACLETLVGQDYPSDKIEILLIDGMSTDRSPEIISAWTARDARIRAFKNPGRSVSAGMNLGIREARHDLILWTSGHVLLEPDHLKRCVATMGRTGAAAVGGVLRTVGKGPLGRANAAVLSSPFGVGGGRHRIGGSSGWVDAVTMALYSKQAIVEAGGFDEAMVRSQDIDLHGRMKALGLKSYLATEVRPTYLCRNSLRALLGQAWWNGYWNVILAKSGGRGLSPRHLTPMAFVAGVLLLALLALIWAMAQKLLFVCTAAYTLGALVATLIAAVRHRLSWQILILPLLFFLLHVSYGLGSWQAVFRRQKSDKNSG